MSRFAAVVVMGCLFGGRGAGADPVEFKLDAGHITAVTFSPDGKTLAAAGSAQAVRIWDVATSKERVTFKPHTRQVLALAFSPDGKRLATGGYGPGKPDDLFTSTGEVCVCDPATGKTLRSFDLDRGIEAVAFTPDGRQVAAAGGDLEVRGWDIKTGEDTLWLEGHKAGVRGLGVDAAGGRLLSASHDGTVRAWDLKTGKPGVVLDCGKGRALCVATSPDGLRAVVGHGFDVRVWDLKTGKEERRLEGHTGPVLAVAVSPDGKAAVSAAALDGGELIVWELATGKEARRIKFPKDGGAYRVAYSPDGKTFAAGCWGGVVRVYAASEK